jgi:hypothetical protein
MAAAYVVTSALGGLMAALAGAFAGAEPAMLAIVWLLGSSVALGGLAVAAARHGGAPRDY